MNLAQYIALTSRMAPIPTSVTATFCHGADGNKARPADPQDAIARMTSPREVRTVLKFADAVAHHAHALRLEDLAEDADAAVELLNERLQALTGEDALA